MNTILIMLPQPILVSDKPSMRGMICYDVSDGNIFKKEYDCAFHPQTYQRPVNEWSYKPIIAGIEGLPKLDLSAIAEEIGWVDVEKLAKEETKNYIGHDLLNIELFIKGFKAAQSLNEKKYTLSNIQEAWKSGQQSHYPNGCDANLTDKRCQCRKESDCFYPTYPTKEEFIKSLSKPKEYNVVDYTQEGNTIKVTKIL